MPFQYEDPGVDGAFPGPIPQQGELPTPYPREERVTNNTKVEVVSAGSEKTPPIIIIKTENERPQRGQCYDGGDFGQFIGRLPLESKRFFGRQIDLPTNSLLNTERDGLYLLTFSCVVKTSSSTANSAAVLEYQVTLANGSNFTVSAAVDLTVTGQVNLQTTQNIMGQTPILWSFTGGSPYGNASVNLFGSALRLA